MGDARSGVDHGEIGQRHGHKRDRERRESVQRETELFNKHRVRNHRSGEKEADEGQNAARADPWLAHERQALRLERVETPPSVADVEFERPHGCDWLDRIGLSAELAHACSEPVGDTGGSTRKHARAAPSPDGDNGKPQRGLSFAGGHADRQQGGNERRQEQSGLGGEPHGSPVS